MRERAELLALFKWSSGYKHMYVCERAIGKPVKERASKRERVVCASDSREKEGKMQFQITCACGAAWVGMCWRE